VTVPANPKMSEVCAEYGVAITTPLSSFRRGAGIVPNTPQNAGVPTTLPIHLSQLAGSALYTPVSCSKSGNASGAFNYTPPPTGPTTVGIATNAVTITGANGTGSYSYSWSLISGDAFSHTANAATTTFSFGSVGRNQTKSAVYRCTVSDGITSAFVDVNVSVTFNYNF
jgi:hypothetical protein